MINEPAALHDAFRPLRQQNLVDAANANHDIQVVGGDGSSVSVGRGRGIHFPTRRRLHSWVKVRLSTDCTDGGVYNCKLAREREEVLPTGSTGSPLTSASLASYPDDDDGIYCNTNEIGKSTHALNETTEITEFWGQYMGVNDDGKYVVEGSGFQVRPCPTPT